MEGKHSPTDVGVIKEKIEKGEVKVKGSNATQTKKQPRKEHSIKGVNGRITDAEIEEWLIAQGVGKQVTSTQLRDGLGFQSRTQARRVLRRLAREGKVVIDTTKISDKRVVFTFGTAPKYVGSA